jgi:hypothetical protein
LAVVAGYSGGAPCWSNGNVVASETALNRWSGRHERHRAAWCEGIEGSSSTSAGAQTFEGNIDEYCIEECVGGGRDGHRL